MIASNSITDPGKTRSLLPPALRRTPECSDYARQVFGMVLALSSLRETHNLQLAAFHTQRRINIWPDSTESTRRSFRRLEQSVSHRALFSQLIMFLSHDPICHNIVLPHFLDVGCYQRNGCRPVWHLLRCILWVL
jgi:hypothetical protein